VTESWGKINEEINGKISGKVSGKIGGKSESNIPPIKALWCSSGIHLLS
jgi:hypothetical protein